MTLVLDKFRTLVPSRAKTSPSGWTSFNAPCCHHRGHSQDKRKRGGLKFDMGVVFNCFNCKYSASWEPGRPLSNKFKNLCRWLGANDDDINQMVFEALKTESPEYTPREVSSTVTFTPKALPEGALAIRDWLEADLNEDEEASLAEVVKYLLARDCDPVSKHFYWSPVEGYKDRVIIPFWYKGSIVGSTARKVKDGRPKYISDHHSHFVYNIDEQKEDQKYIFVTEGPFDAHAIGGVALLTNSIHEQQAKIINSLGQEVIVIPDQDSAGVELIDKADEYNWHVAFPNWGSDVKDVAEAVKRYGKLFVLVDAMKTAVNGSIKLSVAKNNFEHKLENMQ